MTNWKALLGLLVVWVCSGYSSNSFAQRFDTKTWTQPEYQAVQDYYMSLPGAGVESYSYRPDGTGICLRDDVNMTVIGFGIDCAASYPGYQVYEWDTTNTESQNLIDPQNWSGATYGNDPGGCCASISGSGALYDNTTNTILFSYGRDILSQTIAINQALAATGLMVDGYTYGWTYRLISNNGNVGSEELLFDVEVKDASGNVVETYQYNYGAGIGSVDVFERVEGFELFSQSYADPQSVTLKITGKDGGYWGGYYGPEVKDVDLRLLYRANPCASDPLFDASCPGYAEALAQQLYDQNCAANPLYDSGCPGYAQAYFDQQCTVDPLYNSACPLYAQAYYDQQCSIDPLYDSGCSGYEQAYYDQQCSIDPLYDSGCTGYAQAYLDQQCGIDPLYDSTCTGYEEAYYNYQCGLSPLYDSGCDGYAEAYAQENILNEETSSSEETVSATSETITGVIDTEEIGMPSTTGDATVDSVLREISEVSTTTIGVETGGMETMPTMPETQETETAETETVEETSSTEEELVASVEMETQDESEGESSSDVDESMDSEGDKDKDESEESGDGSSESDSGGDSESRKSDSKESKKESKRDKLKKAITKKAMALAENMSNAATLEAQQAVQAQVLALINYVPDFNSYNRLMNGGYLPDAQGYPDTNVPESRRGLRNGLAQQLLHEKMVEMQYNK